MTDTELIKAHDYSINNKEMLMQAEKCGCFYCLSVFKPMEITNWIYGEKERTVLCPHCLVDSVIGESDEIKITQKFLREMHHYWF